MTTGDILWFLAIGAMAYVMIKSGGGCCGGHGHGDHDGLHDDKDSSGNSRKDPVCGMEVEGSGGSLSSEHLGRTFHFCSERCKKLFDLYPNNYI